MNFDQIIKLLEAIAPLLQVLIWPIIVVFLWRAFKIYVEDLRKDKNVSEMGIDVSATGLKFNFKKQVAVATMLVQADAAKQMEKGVLPTASPAQTEAIANVVSQATNPVTAQRIAGAKLLWVDDNPENNTYPRRAMEAVGIHITLSTSTEDALEKVHTDTYDVIISDMGRQPPDLQAPYDSRAGYTLLDKLREQHIFTPFIIYAGSSSPEHQAETKRHGGFGTTNSPQMLFQMVIDAIQQG